MTVLALFCYFHLSWVSTVIRSFKKICRSTQCILSLFTEKQFWLYPHLSYRAIEHGEMNRMSVQSMAIVFGPTLLRPQEESNITMHMVFQNQIVELILNEFNELFQTKWNHPMERKRIHPSAPSSHIPKWTRLLTVFWLLIGYWLSQSIKTKMSQQITSLWKIKRICISKRPCSSMLSVFWYCWNQENKKLCRYDQTDLIKKENV